MLNLLMNRRSIRKYQTKEVEQEKVEQIIKVLAYPFLKNKETLGIYCCYRYELLQKLPM